MGSYVTKAQTPCDPLTQATCTQTCMQIKIVNNTPCPMNFFWEYSYNGCYQFAYAGVVAAGPGSTATFYGQCVSFCDLPCQCPSWLRIQDWSGTGFLPWAYGGPGVGSTATTFIDCLGNVITVTVVVTGPNSATITFS